MLRGILGKKIGMSQFFTEEGVRVPVTIIEAGPCTVQAIKSKEKDGYTAVQLGYDDTKEKRLNKPQRESLKKNKLSPKKFVREFRCDDVQKMKIGDQITNSMFQLGDYVDICGTSKGKGFQGGMKRHNWSGGGESHGSNSHRAPGSVGASSYPSRVFKGQSMAGHMGDEMVTVQNLEVVEVNSEDNTIAVRGAIPGANGGYVTVKYARKKDLAPRIVKEEDEPAKKEAAETKEEGSKDQS